MRAFITGQISTSINDDVSFTHGSTGTFSRIQIINDALETMDISITNEQAVDLLGDLVRAYPECAAEVIIDHGAYTRELLNERIAQEVS